ncbi:MAG: DUF2849 domain-containing protein [Rhodomicrobium sp.]|nr:DUF2849 domain-containing protein [Rhodomicrobium sp.]
MAKKSALHIVTANHLLDGNSIFLGDDGWTTDHHAALVANSTEEAQALELRAKLDEDANRVVGIYLVAVEFDGEGRAEPVHYREKMRASARPSFWPQEVKTRQRPHANRAGGGATHVSL